MTSTKINYKQEEKIKCECPYNSMNNPNPESMYSEEEKIGMKHEPNKCKCIVGLKQYLRNGKKIWLCSCCYILGLDREIK